MWRQQYCTCWSSTTTMEISRQYDSSASPYFKPFRHQPLAARSQGSTKWDKQEELTDRKWVTTHRSAQLGQPTMARAYKVCRAWRACGEHGHVRRKSTWRPCWCVYTSRCYLPTFFVSVWKRRKNKMLRILELTLKSPPSLLYVQLPEYYSTSRTYQFPP